MGAQRQWEAVYANNLPIYFKMQMLLMARHGCVLTEH